MMQEEILELFKKTNAILDGHFLLSSGLHSPTYLQCACVLAYPNLAERLCKHLAQKFIDDKIDLVVAPALGGVIVSFEVARYLGVRGIFTERENSKMALRRGFSISPNQRVLVVEDVVTTGLSTKEVIDVVNSNDGRVIAIAALVDRSSGKVDFGDVKFESLLRLDIKTFDSRNCPLCKEGLPLVKPGSRA